MTIQMPLERSPGELTQWILIHGIVAVTNVKITHNVVNHPSHNVTNIQYHLGIIRLSVSMLNKF
jgi:hypothetical protein